MKKINILSKTVYNRIAAGEVVDRPYSAVKELIENSLDAGADRIDIYIERGGKQLIKIVDNGSGIERDDLPAAFLPHATSKISAVDDLDNITTLGFRGEALASISAISRVEILSVTEGNQAYKISCEGGVVGKTEPAALEKGTEISVRDLFYNTPVRAKFLKPDKKEEADITNFVSRYILGNPEICFRYFVDDKLVLQSFGGGLEEAVAQVYGAKVIPECFKIDALNESVHIHGFIGNQNFFKPNKSYQSIFLNGRYIVNNTIATAISNAYASYAMKRQFPFYVLNVEVPNELVDVNVHPNKADVRFVDNRFIFGAVYKVVSAVLDGTSTAANFVVGAGRVPEIISTIGVKEEQNKVYSAEKTKISADLIEKYKPERAYVAPEEGMRNAPPPIKPVQHDSRTLSEDRVFDPEKDMRLHEFYNAKNELKNFKTFEISEPPVLGVGDNSLSDISRQEKNVDIPLGVQEKIDFETCKYCGNLFNTYLIYEYRNTIYIIDQHAAHERLIFDSLKKKMCERKINRQPILYPYLIETNAAEAQFLEKNIPYLNEMGFSISPFGARSYRVDEIPADLQEINVKNFFDEILSNIDELKAIKLEEVFKDKLASTACKHAIKGGMQLTDREVNELCIKMEGDVGLKCPHGRPVCVALTKREIEKMFKRIV